MALHLIKLCVGCDSISDLEDWIIEKRRRTRGKKTEHIHVTRMVPTARPVRTSSARRSQERPSCWSGTGTSYPHVPW